MNNIAFLTVSSRGKYLLMAPNFTEGKFTPSNQLIDGLEFHLFGFRRSIRANGFGYFHPNNLGKGKEEVRLETFKDLIDRLSDEAQKNEMNVSYILVEVTKDVDSGTNWMLTADYQFLLSRK